MVSDSMELSTVMQFLTSTASFRTTIQHEFVESGGWKRTGWLFKRYFFLIPDMFPHIKDWPSFLISISFLTFSVILQFWIDHREDEWHHFACNNYTLKSWLSKKSSTLIFEIVARPLTRTLWRCFAIKVTNWQVIIDQKSIIERICNTEANYVLAVTEFNTNRRQRIMIDLEYRLTPNEQSGRFESP